MAVLEWDNINERTYEYGVDHGVLHIPGDDVIPWNGLISVDETEVDISELRSFFDGRVYANLQFGGWYQATVKAFGFPDVFQRALGLTAVFPGFSLTAQNRAEFNFAYRTLVEETYYKLHIVHNVMASHTKRESSTVSDKTEAEVFDWTFSVLPPESSTFRPTSHIIVSTKDADPDVVTELENTLYGTSEDDPYFPTQEEIMSMFE